MIAPTATEPDQIIDLTRPADHGTDEVDEAERELLASEDA